MSVEITSNRIDYAGDNVSTVFAYPFLVLDATHFAVYRTSVAGVAALLVQPTDYTVSGISNPAGGNVTLVAPLLTGEKLGILRIVPLKQTATYPVGNKFPSSTHERVVDLLTMITQQITETFGRALKLGIASTQKDKVIDDLVALKHLRVKADASGIEMADAPTGTVSFPITTAQGGLGAAVDGSAAEGDILVRNAGLVFARLAKGATATILRAGASTVAYVTQAVALFDLLTTKGDIAVSTGATVARFAVGADGKALVARAGAAAGLEYGNVGLAGAFHGLQLRTHQDSDKAANQIALLGLKALVMDDGTRYDDVVVPGADAPLTADITVAGAAGLDTGARAVSAWYEAYLIGKSSTKAKADLRLLLHRAKNYLLDQNFIAVVGIEKLRDNAARTALAQGFKTANTGKVERVDVVLQPAGAPTGNVWLELQSDTAGSPSGTVLATSDKMDVSKVRTNQTLAFAFRSPVSLTAATQYHLVLQADYAISAVNYLAWVGDTANNYASGVAKQYSGSAWSATATVLDFSLKVYVTQNDTALTYPGGWDQKCRLGWVYNNSGNTLDPVALRDRRAKPLTNAVSGTFTATVGIVTDLSTILPPAPVAVELEHANSAAGNVTGASGIPEGFAGVSNTLAGGAVQGIAQAANSGTPNGSMGRVVTDFQALYLYVSAGTGQVWASAWEW